MYFIKNKKLSRKPKLVALYLFTIIYYERNCWAALSYFIPFSIFPLGTCYHYFILFCQKYVIILEYKVNNPCLNYYMTWTLCWEMGGSSHTQPSHSNTLTTMLSHSLYRTSSFFYMLTRDLII